MNLIKTILNEIDKQETSYDKYRMTKKIIGVLSEEKDKYFNEIIKLNDDKDENKSFEEGYFNGLEDYIFARDYNEEKNLKENMNEYSYKSGYQTGWAKAKAI